MLRTELQTSRIDKATKAVQALEGKAAKAHKARVEAQGAATAQAQDLRALWVRADVDGDDVAKEIDATKAAIAEATENAERAAVVCSSLDFMQRHPIYPRRKRLCLKAPARAITWLGAPHRVKRRWFLRTPCGFHLVAGSARCSDHRPLCPNPAPGNNGSGARSAQKILRRESGSSTSDPFAVSVRPR